jgi:hypothetical protein
VGETRVDLLHLLEDLRDAYPGAIEETILTEIVANSLDSGASRIRVEADAGQATLAVADDGSGMQRRELARYHDLAASTKTRGEGIGFAGVGIKLGLLVSEEVLTETRRGKTHIATLWHLASRHRAPWKWVPAPGLVNERGTSVRLKLQNALSPLLDPGFLEATLRRHYQPLLDPAFEQFLAPHYPRGVLFEVNGRVLEKHAWQAPEVAPLEVRLVRKRKPSAVGFLVRHAQPVPEERRGIGISTFGKIIKRGWDWLGVTPQTPERVGGLIEVPALAACLTLNKGDFIRVGARGAAYLAYRKAIQEAVSRQLTAWGDAREPAEEARRRVARPLERDLERVIEDLSRVFPLLASLVEHRVGGQKKLPIGKNGEPADGPALAPAFTTPATEQAETGPCALELSPGVPEMKEAGRPEPPSEPGPSASAGTPLPGTRGTRRPAHYGLGIQFEHRPDDPELGRLVESTVWVNTAHPAYQRAIASRAEGYHLAISVALALAPLATDPKGEHTFVTAFLSHWGKALDRSGGRRR